MADTDSMQEWPEPVVRVQAVAESGLADIPGCYVKPPRDRPAVQHLATAADVHEPSDISVPVIDLGELLEGRIDSLITEAVAAACREWGFFQVVNHGVAPELMRAAREAWRGFFRLPIPAKQQYANLPRTYEGYGSRIGVQKGGPLDWGDYYFLHLAPEAAKSPDNYWPTNPGICKSHLVSECVVMIPFSKQGIPYVFATRVLLICKIGSLRPSQLPRNSVADGTMLAHK